jgi:hypothetical protein
MRYKLLAYYSNPAAQPAGKPDWKKCESKFEERVGRIIYDERKYRLIPQYEPFGPHGYRIDFVIEGLKSRLAVECDGSHHLEPEQIERDMFRQRQLERCGWVFWRVAESSFYFDREKAMASLWRKLEELEIHPLTEVPLTSLTETLPPLERPRFSPNKSPLVSHFVAQSAPPSRQPDLIPSNQMELPASDCHGPTDRTHQEIRKGGVNLALREYVLAAKQKRPHGVLIYEEIGHVVLEIMPKQGRVDRKELISSAAEVLDFSEAAFKRIDEAIRRLQELKKVGADSNSVWLHNL